MGKKQRKQQQQQQQQQQQWRQRAPTLAHAPPRGIGKAHKKKDRQSGRMTSTNGGGGADPALPSTHAAASGAPPPLPYSRAHPTLLLGEGDFSFAASLALVWGDAHQLTATAYDSEDVATAKYASLAENVETVRSCGGTVLFGVDATRCHSHGAVVRRGTPSAGFERIIFNFPHSGSGIKDQARNITANQQMLRGTFQSAQRLLAHPNGELHLTLKRGEPYDSWSAVALAKMCGLRTPLRACWAERRSRPNAKPRAHSHARAGEPCQARATHAQPHSICRASALDPAHSVTGAPGSARLAPSCMWHFSGVDLQACATAHPSDQPASQAMHTVDRLATSTQGMQMHMRPTQRSAAVGRTPSSLPAQLPSTGSSKPVATLAPRGGKERVQSTGSAVLGAHPCGGRRRPSRTMGKENQAVNHGLPWQTSRCSLPCDLVRGCLCRGGLPDFSI